MGAKASCLVCVSESTPVYFAYLPLVRPHMEAAVSYSCCTHHWANLRVRGINLPCKQRFQGLRWGGAGRSPARIFFYFSIFSIFFCNFKEKKGDVLTNI